MSLANERRSLPPAGLERPNPEAIAVPARPAEAFDPDLEATVIVQRPAFYRHAVLGGNLSIAESYLRGDWSCSDLTPLFRLFARNIALSDSMDQGLRRLLHWPCATLPLVAREQPPRFAAEYPPSLRPGE